MKKIIALFSIVLLAVACKKATPTPNNPIPTNVDGEKLIMVVSNNNEYLDTNKYVYDSNNKIIQIYSSTKYLPGSSNGGDYHIWKTNISSKFDSVIFDSKYTNNNNAQDQDINYIVLNQNGTINKLGTIGDEEILLFEYSSNKLSKVSESGFFNDTSVVLNWKDENLISIGNSSFEYYLDKQNNISSVLEFVDRIGDVSIVRGYDSGLYTKNLIKRETYTNEDKSVDTYLYTYKFDTYGRVIERTIKDEKDGSVLYVFKYTWSK